MARTSVLVHAHHVRKGFFLSILCADSAVAYVVHVCDKEGV